MGATWKANQFYFHFSWMKMGLWNKTWMGMFVLEEVFNLLSYLFIWWWAVLCLIAVSMYRCCKAGTTTHTSPYAECQLNLLLEEIFCLWTSRQNVLVKVKFTRYRTKYVVSFLSSEMYRINLMYKSIKKNIYLETTWNQKISSS